MFRLNLLDSLSLTHTQKPELTLFFSKTPMDCASWDLHIPQVSDRHGNLQNK